MRFSGFIACLTGILTVLNFGIGSRALLPSAVIIPLYIYPNSDCGQWSPLIVSALPSAQLKTLQFIVVINPNSGPGRPNPQPNTDYQKCITRLRSAGIGNVKIIGYVATGFGSPTLAASGNITKDIDTYAGWNGAYRPEGIFFDEAVTNPGNVSDYRRYALHVREKFGSNAYVTLNPGVWDKSPSISSPEYFSFSNLIVTFEDKYNNFKISRFPTGLSTPTSKQAAIIHTGPANMPLSAPVDTIKVITQQLRLGASFYTNVENKEAYHKFSTTWMGYLTELVTTQTRRG